ncbi:wall surface anchor family domain protein, partial [Chlamydia psittaci 84-8471/1]
YLL